MTETELLDALKAALGADVLAAGGAGFDCWAWVAKGRVREALQLFKGALGFNVLVDHTAADLSQWPGGKWTGVSDPCQATQGSAHERGAQTDGRFELTWRLMRLNEKSGLVEGRAALKCRVSDGEAGPPSVRDLWPCADWLEREVWDMFGVKPEGRPDIKRLLLYEEFKGHPLRKDYPITKRQPLVAPLPAPEGRIAPEELRPRVTDPGLVE